MDGAGGAGVGAGAGVAAAGLAVTTGAEFPEPSNGFDWQALNKTRPLRTA